MPKVKRKNKGSVTKKAVPSNYYTVFGNINVGVEPKGKTGGSGATQPSIWAMIKQEAKKKLANMVLIGGISLVKGGPGLIEKLITSWGGDHEAQSSNTSDVVDRVDIPEDLPPAVRMNDEDLLV